MNNILFSPVPLDDLNAQLMHMIEQTVAKCLSKLEPPRQEEFLTCKQAATLLSVSLPTLHEWTKHGIVKGYRINTRVRYKRSDLESAMEQIKSVRG